MTVGEDRVGKRVGLLLQGSTSNTLSSAPQSDQYQNRWTQLPHYERRGETLSLWPHLCQHLQMLFLAVNHVLCEPAQWVTDDTTVCTSWATAPVKGYLVALLLEEKVSFPRQ